VQRVRRTAEADEPLRLARKGYFDGTSAHGRAAPYYLATGSGVVLTSPSSLALYEPSLAACVWRREGIATASRFWTNGSSLYYGSASIADGTGEEFLELDLATGRTMRGCSVPASLFVGATDNTILLLTVAGSELLALDRSDLTELWRVPSHPELQTAPSSADMYFTTSPRGRQLQGLAAASGEIAWEFEPPGHGLSEAERRWNRVASCYVAGGRVVVTTLDGRVFALALDTGELLGSGEPESRGVHRIGPGAVYFLQPFGLSEYDYVRMREVGRVDYRSSVEGLYGEQEPSVRGFCVTDELVVWTTANGAVMATARSAEADTDRCVWVDSIPGALMPIGENPVECGGYIYLRVLADVHEGPYGVYCWKTPVLPNGRPQKRL
jgi:hypothetical protein